MVGFTGSRFISSEVKKQVSQLAISCVLEGHTIAVGCAIGTDHAVRLAVPDAKIFQANGHKPWQLVQRSQGLVQAVVASGGFRAMVGFSTKPCPPGLVPSASPSGCFYGHGSGTWGTLAFAKGMGVPIFIYWGGYGPLQLPESWGRWVCSQGQSIFAGSWSPQSHSLSLF